MYLEDQARPLELTNASYRQLRTAQKLVDDVQIPGGLGEAHGAEDWCFVATARIAPGFEATDWSQGQCEPSGYQLLRCH